MQLIEHEVLIEKLYRNMTLKNFGVKIDYDYAIDASNKINESVFLLSYEISLFEGSYNFGKINCLFKTLIEEDSQIISAALVISKDSFIKKYLEENNDKIMKLIIRSLSEENIHIHDDANGRIM